MGAICCLNRKVNKPLNQENVDYNNAFDKYDSVAAKV